MQPFADAGVWLSRLNQTPAWFATRGNAFEMQDAQNAMIRQSGFALADRVAARPLKVRTV
jgi:hypothetical protein